MNNINIEMIIIKSKKTSILIVIDGENIEKMYKYFELFNIIINKFR